MYQGDLPPLAAPGGLIAEAEAGGHIRLTWNEVAEAAGYVLYRKAPGEADLTLYENLSPMTEYLDESLSAGTYYYALSSLRDQNGQVSESGLSEPVHATADSENPGPPSSLSVDMVPQGMKIEWQAPDPYTEPVTYNLYRASGEIYSLEGLTPLAEDIDQTLVVDPSPSATDRCYAVSAVDGVGNESSPSNTDCYINVLPVTALNVVQEDLSLPPLWVPRSLRASRSPCGRTTRPGGMRSYT